MILLPDDLNNEYDYQKKFKAKQILSSLYKIIVFLDFDGVTHPLGSKNFFIEKERIENLLLEDDRISIVFSTSWTDDHSFEELKNIFDENLDQRFIGVVKPHTSNRGSDCKKWLIEHNLHPEKTPWLAVDDVSIFDLEDPVVRTNTLKGLQDDTFKVLQEAIKNPFEYKAFVAMEEEKKQFRKESGLPPKFGFKLS
jgi:hypothetical protein